MENESKIQIIEDEEVCIDRLSDDDYGIFVLSLNNYKSANALSRNFSYKIVRCLNILAKNKEMRILIIRSKFPNIFSSGADLKELKNISNKDYIDQISEVRKIANTLYEFSMPTIAAIDGAAIGGGLELALAADMRIVASNAKLGMVATKLAIIPGGGGTQILDKMLPKHLANELIFTGRIFDGNSAYKMGLANYFVNQNNNGDSAYLRAIDLAMEIAKNSPIALKVAKLAMNIGSDISFKSGLVFEEICFSRVIHSEDSMGGKVAWKEKQNSIYFDK